MASAWPSSWQARASTFRPSSTAAPSAYESEVRNTDCSPVNHCQPNAPSPSTATVPISAAAARVNSSRPPALYRKPTTGSTLASTIRRPCANASSPRPSRSGHGRRRTRCNGANASTGSSSSIRLPARSATIRRTCSGANCPEMRANSATNRANVRLPSMSRVSAYSSGANRR